VVSLPFHSSVGSFLLSTFLSLSCLCTFVRSPSYHLFSVFQYVSLLCLQTSWSSILYTVEGKGSSQAFAFSLLPDFKTVNNEKQAVEEILTNSDLHRDLGIETVTDIITRLASSRKKDASKHQQRSVQTSQCAKYPQTTQTEETVWIS
jgi:hypothetical protein